MDFTGLFCKMNKNKLEKRGIFMKRFFKVVCMVMVLTFSVINVKDVYAMGVQSRALMRYEMSALSSSGRINVYGYAVVQDSSSTIIDYSITYIATASGVTNASITHSGISSNGKQVYINVSYYYNGVHKSETVYFNI